MSDRTYLEWPFFSAEHRTLAKEIGDWAEKNISAGHVSPHDSAGINATCRSTVQALGASGWLRYAVPASAGGANESLDVRSLCLIREALAYRSGLADFSFALQGLGSGPITFSGNSEQRKKYLPAIARGVAISAFAISEEDAGSDVAAMKTTARRDDDHFVIDGSKTWISNAGIADFFVVFARFPEQGERSYVALIVEKRTPGLTVGAPIAVTAPHPLGSLTFKECRVPASALVGEPGAGLRVAFTTLDVFRSTVGAAALGMARRALDEALAFARTRQSFGKSLTEFQIIQAKLADMAVAIDASALLVYRAAWTKDVQQRRVTREAAMAKLHATEAAQQVIDQAVQIMGGRGVVADSITEALYREVRALRIYEGTSEIQKIVIATQLLESAGKAHGK